MIYQVAKSIDITLRGALIAYMPIQRLFSSFSQDFDHKRLFKLLSENFQIDLTTSISLGTSRIPDFGEITYLY